MTAVIVDYMLKMCF